ncbi:MAG: CRISPR system precrRNA processing endoribonuclease RAMP protein Cas6 [Chloroflexota bacterium]
MRIPTTSPPYRSTAPMLLSLLLTLTPTKPTTLEGFYGRQVQAWFLNQVAQHDPGMAEELHHYNGMRPYTLSSLILPQAGPREENGEVHVLPGNECQIRITSLSTSLSEFILSSIISNLPQTLRLKWSDFKELRLSKENQWDRQTTFEDLVREAENASSESVTLEFASPTAFRSGQIDLTLPTPDQVWRSLWWRWNTFAPVHLHIDPLWPEFAAKCIVVSDFLLRSMKVTFKQGEKGAATGCTGRATYRLLPERHCGDYAPFRPGTEQVLCTLAGFAIFSGIGHHTTIGLGQSRWMDNLQADVNPMD